MRSWPFPLLLSLLLLAGCGSGTKKEPKPDPSNYLLQTSIPNVLANLTRAYTERNYEEYAKLLHENFEYIFAPQDIGGPNNIPASWGRADDLLSAHNMFGQVANRDGYFAESISLTFTAGADTPTNLNPDWRKVVATEVNLRVNGRHSTTHDPLTYEVLGDKADLYLVQTSETAPGTDLRVWKIVRWEDKPIMMATPATQNTSWGRIRANFH